MTQLSPGELLELLGIELQRLRVWLQRGLLGEHHRKTGRGNPRVFSRQDAIIALVIRELMDLTNARSFEVARGLLRDVALAMPKVLKGEGVVISSSTGNVDPTWWIILSFDHGKHGWHFTSVQGGGSGFPHRDVNDGSPGYHSPGERQLGQAVILLPLGELIQEVDRFLEKRKAQE